MTDNFDDLYSAWVNDLTKLSKKWSGDVQEAMEGYVDSVMRDAFDPQKFMDFIRRSGVNFTGLPGAMKGQEQTAVDPYRILGLDRSASDEEVKKRYRALAHKLHPDTSGEKGTECFFQMVQIAYEVIKRERGW
jgi:DnaJ-class molecular chaperone